MKSGFPHRILCCILCCALLWGLSAPAQAASSGFADVPAAHWACDSIARAAKAGLVQGETKTTFGLGHPMSRAAFTVVVCRLFGWQTEAPDRGSFTDVQDSSVWYFGAVETALAHGALTRQTDAFRPADPITREEMAVMLVRALGYTTLAGLNQRLACPFADVETNAGYLAMANRLGISSGTAANAFSPDRTATREQAVVMLMRVYDRLHAPAPERIGVADSADADMTGCAVVAVASVFLSSIGRTTLLLSDQQAQALRDSARAAGAKAVLHFTGDALSLTGDAVDTAGVIAAQVERGGWDGAMLDVTGLSAGDQATYTALCTAIRSALGTKLLYITAAPPASDGAASGYNCPALSALADRLILRVAPYQKTVNDFPTAPQEPLEEVYYALSVLRSVGVDGKKLSLWLTTTGSAWNGTRSGGSVDAGEIQDLLALDSVQVDFSARYAQACLTRTVGQSRSVVWYHDAAAVTARRTMASFFGVDSLCLSDLASLTREVRAALGQ